MLHIFRPWFYFWTMVLSHCRPCGRMHAMVLSLNHGLIFGPWFYLWYHGFIFDTMVLSLNHGFIFDTMVLSFEPWFYLWYHGFIFWNHGFIFWTMVLSLNHGFISLQALRKDAYDHFTAIYYLLLDRLKMDQSRALTGDQVMIMPVCVSLVISLVTNPTCCHGH